MLALLLTLPLMVFCFSLSVAEETAQTPEPEFLVSGDYEYVILEDETAEIVRYSGNTEDLNVPNELDGSKITGIGDSAFYECSFITSVVIPDGVTRIGDYAFYGCSSMISVTIPESVIDIGVFSFASVPAESLIDFKNPDIPEGIEVSGLDWDDYYFPTPIPGLVITVFPGSYAEQYCQNNGIRYEYQEYEYKEWLNTLSAPNG